MLRKVGIVSALLLALPAFANAWTVTAKIGSGKGTVSDGTKTIALGQTGVPSIGYYKVANLPLVADQTFTVTPTSGYSVSSVIVNGAPATANGDGTFTVAAGSPIRNNQSLVVYFKQNLSTVTATQPDTTQGRIVLQACDVNGNTYGARSMTGISGLKSGSYVKVTAYPNADYKVTGLGKVGALTTSTSLQGDVASAVVPVDGSWNVTAEFAQVPVVKPNFALSKYIVSPGDTVTVTPAAVSNMTGVTYAATTTATDATVSGTNPFSIKYPTSGTYSVTVTATVGGQSFPITKADVITVQPNNACTTCHSNRNAAITTAWQTGAHGNASGHNTNYCQRCHATEGAITGFAAGYTGGYTDVLNTTAAKTAYDAVKPAASSNGISCTVCHAQDPHNGGNNLRAVNTFDGYGTVAWDPNNNGVVDQYDVCTACHTINDNAGKLVGNYHDGSSMSIDRTISDTHGVDDPATDAAQTTGPKTIEGYVIRKNSATPCADCHNLHSANVEIQRAWAKSNHGGKIAVRKEAALEAYAVNLAGTDAKYAQATTLADNKIDSLGPWAYGGKTITWLEYSKSTAGALTAVRAAGAMDDEAGNAWTHYPWDANSRSDCQHCHTSTGAANFLKAAEAGTAYDKTKNDFSHLSGWTTLGSGQQEMLFCWGCHSDAQTGAQNTTKAITLDYTVNGAATTVTAPDNGKSASCLSCHSGRGNVEALIGNTTPDPSAAAVASPATKSHYLAAGLSLNQAKVKAGYTFGKPAADYADAAYYKHNKLGCAECHMTSAEAHTFDVVEKNDTGVITQVASSKCVECHTGAHGAALTNVDFTDAAGVLHTAADGAAFLQEEAEGYHQALQVLKDALIAKGFTVSDGYPYVGVGTNASFINQGNSGAAYNYSYLHHEPGAYAHNRLLAKRLIFDSIDWLNDGQLNNNVVIPDTAPIARIWLGADATGAAVRP